jgi:parallel beta-helix repeat protein
MNILKTFAIITTVVCGVLLGTGRAEADDISGTITSTWTIYENSRLVGDVTCLVVDEPCIKFGASHIKLRLNGFTMTGRANPPANCVPPNITLFLPEDGIATDGQSHVAILGPGLVQKFRRYGIIVGVFPNPTPLISSSKATVKRVTSHHNCFSGLQLAFVTESVIAENVSVRNASASGAFPCGGTCIVESDNNRIQRNVYSGNGSVAGPNNDFGIGILGGSDGNVIEENSVGGNTNGIWVAATAGTGNVVRRNIIAGNPPVELVGATVGFDIRDNSPAGRVTFKENLCITYLGFATPPPCPNIPKFAGHRHPRSHDGDDDDEDRDDDK